MLDIKVYLSGNSQWVFAALKIALVHISESQGVIIFFGIRSKHQKYTFISLIKKQNKLYSIDAVIGLPQMMISLGSKVLLQSKINKGFVLLRPMIWNCWSRERLKVLLRSFSLIKTFLKNQTQNMYLPSEGILNLISLAYHWHNFFIIWPST